MQADGNTPAIAGPVEIREFETLISRLFPKDKKNLLPPEDDPDGIRTRIMELAEKFGLRLDYCKALWDGEERRISSALLAEAVRRHHGRAIAIAARAIDQNGTSTAQAKYQGNPESWFRSLTFHLSKLGLRYEEAGMEKPWKLFDIFAETIRREEGSRTQGVISKFSDEKYHIHDGEPLIPQTENRPERKTALRQIRKLLKTRILPPPALVAAYLGGNT